MTTDHPVDPAGSTPTRTGAAEPGHARGCGCVSRRESLVVAGVAVAGTAGLTACGAEADVEAAVSSAGARASSVAGSVASAATSAAASAAAGAIAAADVPVGGGRVFEELKVVVTQPSAGEFKAFSAVCTHEGCTVTGVADGVITCPCHGSQFDIATGEVRNGPATRALDAKTVTVGANGVDVS